MRLSWEHGGGSYTEHYTAELPKNAQETLLTPLRPLYSVWIFASPYTTQTAKFLAVPRKNASTSGFNFDTTHSQPMGKSGKGTKNTSHFLNSWMCFWTYLPHSGVHEVPWSSTQWSHDSIKNSPASLELIQEEVFLPGPIVRLLAKGDTGQAAHVILAGSGCTSISCMNVLKALLFPSPKFRVWIKPQLFQEC